MQTEVMTVRGMSGEACADKVASTLRAIAGVDDVAVSYAVGKATVRFDEDKTSTQELQASLARAGYRVATAAGGSCGGGCCGGCGGN